jgi:hypothetical protein
MSEQDDKATSPSMTANTVVVLTGTRGDSTVESRVFNSVAAAAVYFAYVARRAYSRANMSGDALMEAVAADTAVLFAGYDNTTGEDDPVVQVGGVKYEAKLTAVLDEELASDDGRAIGAKEGA